MKYVGVVLMLVQLFVLVYAAFRIGFKTGAAVIGLLLYLFGMFFFIKYVEWNVYLFIGSMLGLLFFALLAVFVWVNDAKKNAT